MHRTTARSEPTYENGNVVQAPVIGLPRDSGRLDGRSQLIHPPSLSAPIRRLIHQSTLLAALCDPVLPGATETRSKTNDHYGISPTKAHHRTFLRDLFGSYRDGSLILASYMETLAMVSLVSKL